MATSLRIPRSATLLLLSLLCLPALACGGDSDDDGSTSGGGVAASGGGVIGGGSTTGGGTGDTGDSGANGDTGDSGYSASAGGSGDSSDNSGGSSGDDGGDDGGDGKVPTAPLHIPPINYKGRPFDDVTDFGRQTWELIQNDVRTACKDGTVCLRLERLYSVDLPESETAGVAECGFVKISPVAGTKVDPQSPLTIIGLGPCLGGTPDDGSSPEESDPVTPPTDPETPSTVASDPVPPSTSTP
ncbi:hypothetical protein ACFWZ2_38170 [Streptomyces sp. NPDC059002]|uniref:hypothetical protein n=1 Tax=Streptomyces sp. NPDC059002 TaxID=3346690 RepID=UPI003691185A